MSDSIPELLPCPLCGSSRLTLGRKVAGHGDSVKSIHCSCGIEFAPMSLDVDIVKAWNTRSKWLGERAEKAIEENRAQLPGGGK